MKRSKQMLQRAISLERTYCPNSSTVAEGEVGGEKRRIGQRRRLKEDS
jgi:hypothetical protein